MMAMIATAAQITMSNGYGIVMPLDRVNQITTAAMAIITTSMIANWTMLITHPPCPYNEAGQATVGSSRRP
jgi:hypothetical protein